MDAITITWYRLIMAFVILFCLLSIKGNLPKIGQLSMMYVGLMVISCLGLCINYITYVMGLDIVGPGPSQVLIQFNSVLVILGGIFIFKERFNREQISGLFIIIIGLGMFFHNKLEELFTSLTNYSFGVFLLIISATALATYSLAQKQLLVKFSSVQISMLVFGAGAIFLLPITAKNLSQIIVLEWPAIALLLFCVVTTLLAFGSFAEALEHWETTKISAVLATVPLIALAFAELAAILYPNVISTDPVSLISLTGAIILVVGSLMVTRNNS